MRGYHVTAAAGEAATISTLLPQGAEMDHVMLLNTRIPVHPQVKEMIPEVQKRGMDLYRSSASTFKFLAPGILDDEVDKTDALVLLDVAPSQGGAVVLSSLDAEQHYVNKLGQLCSVFREVDNGAEVLLEDHDNAGVSTVSSFLIQLSPGSGFRAVRTGPGVGPKTFRVHWGRDRFGKDKLRVFSAA